MARGRNTVTFSANTAEVSAYLKDIGVNIGKASRPVAQAGAQVLYEEAKRLSKVGDQAFHKFYGTQYKKDGTYYIFQKGSLRNSIYQKFSTSNSSKTNSVYHVSYNWRFAPYAGFIEWGTSKMPSYSFIRQAGINKEQAALEAMRVVAIEKITKILAGEKL